MKEPWDQLDNEPDEAYARFLCYRNLGPGRSISRAFEIHTGAKKSPKRQVCGSWSDESSSHSWLRRATAWDIGNLREQGRQVALIWSAAIIAAVRKVHDVLVDPSKKPKGFDSAMAAMEKLSKYVNADAINSESVQPNPGSSEQEPTIPLDRAAVA